MLPMLIDMGVSWRLDAVTVKHTRRTLFGVPKTVTYFAPPTAVGSAASTALSKAYSAAELAKLDREARLFTQRTRRSRRLMWLMLAAMAALVIWFIHTKCAKIAIEAFQRCDAGPLECPPSPPLPPPPLPLPPAPAPQPPVPATRDPCVVGKKLSNGSVNDLACIGPAGKVKIDNDAFSIRVAVLSQEYHWKIGRSDAISSGSGQDKSVDSIAEYLNSAGLVDAARGSMALVAVGAASVEGNDIKDQENLADARARALLIELRKSKLAAGEGSAAQVRHFLTSIGKARSDGATTSPAKVGPDSTAGQRRVMVIMLACDGDEADCEARRKRGVTAANVQLLINQALDDDSFAFPYRKGEYSKLTARGLTVSTP